MTFQCYVCKEIKENIEKVSKRNLCKLCHAANIRKYRDKHSDKLKPINAAMQREWRAKNSDKLKEINRRAYLKHRDKRLQHAYNRNLERPEISAAHMAVYYAIQKGQIVPPKVCQHCGSVEHVQHHHYMGYHPNNRLDVWPLCQRCHEREHVRLSQPFYVVNVYERL